MSRDREEFCKRVEQDENERIKEIKELLPKRFIKLKDYLEEIKKENSLEEDKMQEEVKLTEELIQLCESKYGENFSRLYRISDKKILELYVIVIDFIDEMEKIKNKQLKASNRSIDE